ncbi:hypothetical protein FIBSPDRAFT_960608 [Athelia psychrophila]|uniref:Uncharacterized protein n=1 Tax=Athelia psychrophila TaxID=1759441 RepID=A0A166C5S6_9AGAM|nr:hypothetical protein FIBSPDRAFT_960608 [Fibularhizoctonia sp. CBS 109695]
MRDTSPGPDSDLEYWQGDPPISGSVWDELLALEHGAPPPPAPIETSEQGGSHVASTPAHDGHSGLNTVVPASSVDVGASSSSAAVTTGTYTPIDITDPTRKRGKPKGPPKPRGRPKKTVDPDAPVKEKQPVGRPAKVVDPDAPVKEKRPVGRPTKAVDPDAPVKEKQPIGRPAKAVDPNAPVKEKQPVGRPAAARLPCKNIMMYPSDLHIKHHDVASAE